MFKGAVDFIKSFPDVYDGLKLIWSLIQSIGLGWPLGVVGPPVLAWVLHVWWKSNHSIDSDIFDGEFEVRRPATLAHARAANEAVRRRFRRWFRKANFIPWETYKSLMEMNPEILTVIEDERGKVAGFFDIFPLRDEFGTKFLIGKETEKNLNVEAVCNPETAHSSNLVYIGTIFNAETVDGKKKYHISVMLHEKLIETIFKLYPPSPSRRYLAIASTEEGRKVLVSYKFTRTQDGRDRSDGSDLYVLQHSQVDAAIKKIKTRFPTLLP
jgi:hypothetical protein